MTEKRFKINLKLYKNKIVSLYHNNYISVQIINHFTQNYKITITIRTIKKNQKNEISSINELKKMNCYYNVAF